MKIANMKMKIKKLQKINYNKSYSTPWGSINYVILI